MSNSAKLRASIWIKNTFWLLSSTIIWTWRLFNKSKLPEVQINLHFGKFELVKSSPINFEISRFNCSSKVWPLPGASAIDLLIHFPQIYCSMWYKQLSGRQRQPNSGHFFFHLVFYNRASLKHSLQSLK